MAIKQERNANRRVGPLQAFVRLKSLWRAGRPDFKKLGQMFREEREARSEDYKTAVAMSVAARKAAHSAMPRLAGSAFGHNSRGTRKSRLKVARLRLWGQAAGKTPEQRMALVAQHVARKRLPLQDSLSLARSVSRFGTAQLRAAQDLRLQSLVEFRAAQQATTIRRVVEALPGLSEFHLRAEPAGPCAVVEVLPPSAEQVVGTTAAAQSWASSSNLAASLEGAWRQLTQMVLHGQSPPLPAATETDKKATLCCNAGTCLCSTEGQRTKRIGQRLLAYMRRAFPVGSEKRAQLLDGHVVLSIMWEPDTTDFDTIIEAEEPFGEMLLHIGLQYLQPFRPTFLKMEHAEAGQEMPAIDGRRYAKAVGASIWVPPPQHNNLGRDSGYTSDVHLMSGENMTSHPRGAVVLAPIPSRPHRQATVEVLTFYEAMVSLTDRGSLFVASYVLEDCLRPIGSFNVSTVPLVPLDRTAAYQFYPPPARGADKHPRKKARRAEDDFGAPPLEDGMEELESANTTEEEIDDSFVEYDQGHDGEGSLEAFLDSVRDELVEPLPEPVGQVRPNGAGERPADEGEALGAELGVPPPPQPVELGAAGMRRNKGEATVVFRWGKITFYASKGVFEATCRNPEHGKCVLTRTHKGKPPSAPGRFPKGGRPLGLLAAWMEKGGVGSKEEHWAPNVLKPTLAMRRAGREYIRLASNGIALLSKERPLAEGEPDEPLSLDGLV